MGVWVLRILAMSKMMALVCSRRERMGNSRSYVGYCKILGVCLGTLLTYGRYQIRIAQNSGTTSLAFSFLFGMVCAQYSEVAGLSILAHLGQCTWIDQ
jgi:hypothetical protein